MKDYSCEKCGKKFYQKGDYIKHINRKYPCITQAELLHKVGSLDATIGGVCLDHLFAKLRDILRDSENIVGKDAVLVIADVLLLRLLKPLLVRGESGSDSVQYINMLDSEYDEDPDVEANKKYIYWDNLIEKLNGVKTNTQKNELDYIIRHVIFKGVLRLHRSTADLFRDRVFAVKKTLTMMSLLQEVNKVTDAQLVGGRVGWSSGDDDGWIVKYVVGQMDFRVDKDGQYDKVLDPFCGDGRFLVEYCRAVGQKAKQEDVLLDRNVQNCVKGYEAVYSSRQLAIVNLLLEVGVFCHGVKQEEFVKHSGDFSKNLFKGHLLTRITGGSGSSCGKLLEKCYGVVADGYKCGVWLDNGKLDADVRKRLVAGCKLYKVGYVGGGRGSVLLFEKGGLTKEVVFVELRKNKDGSCHEVELGRVKVDRIVAKDCCLDFEDYGEGGEEGDEREGDSGFVKLADMCTMTVAGGCKTDGGSNLFVGVGDLNGGIVVDTKGRVSDKMVEKCSLKMIDKEDVLMPANSWCGKKVSLVGRIRKTEDLYQEQLKIFSDLIGPEKVDECFEDGIDDDVVNDISNKSICGNNL